MNSINYSYVNLIKLCSTCAKQKSRVKTANGICSMLALYSSDSVLKRKHSFFIKFEQVIMKYFFV